MILWRVVSWPLELSGCTWRKPEDADRWSQVVSGMIAGWDCHGLLGTVFFWTF